MKHIGIMNNGKSSKPESRFLAIPQLLRRIVAICLLALVSTGAWATDYVIFNGTYYYEGIGNVQCSGSNTGGCRTSVFNPKSCIWTGTSGGSFQNEIGYYIVYWTGYPGTKDSEPTNCTLSGTESGNTGKTITVGNSSYKYLYFTGSYWDLSNNSKQAATCVYAVTTDNTHIDGTSVSPTISGDKTFTTKGESYTFSKTLASYIPGYIDYIFYSNTHHYFKPDNETALTAAPTESEEFDYTWSLSPNANGYVSVNSSTGVVTYNKIYHTDTEVTLTLTATSRESGKVLTATKQITFKASTVSPTAVSVTSTTPMTVYVGQTGNISYSLTPATCYDNVLFETGDASIATVNANGIVSGVSAGSTTITVKAMKYNSTENVSATVTVNVLNKVATPTISFTDEGKFTISCATSGATIHYTTNGDEPTTSDATIGNGVQSSTTVAVETVVKAIAVLVGYVQSDVASNQFLKSGISGNKVILNDYEDHNWTYYQSQDNLPNGYPIDYLSSPNPRNVKITYQGGEVDGASAVAISGLDGEGQNTMIYYKTLEKHDLSVKDDGEYAYTVISNPFSKRPRKTGSSGTNGYYGFAGWKIISGGEYITEHSNNDVLALDETIHFTNLDNGYTPNCTSAEVVFEATWTTATVKNLTSATVPTFTGGTYETNFLLLGANINSAITISSPCTLMARNPDGTIGNYNNYSIRGVAAGTDNVKLEYIQMNLGFYTNAYIKAEGYNFTIGRGVNNTLKSTPDDLGGFVYGLSSNKSSNNTFKIESGQYYLVVNFGNISSSILNGITVSSDRAIDQLMILGCDYDRAKNDNSQLTIFSNILTGNFSTTDALNRSSGDLYVRYDVKSGNLCSEIVVKGNNVYSGGINDNFYTSIGGQYQRGRRFFLMEGGRVSGIAGGQDADDSQKTTDRAVDMRIRGTAQIDGNVYGAAEYAGGRGIRTMIFTGGNINGWIAGGANGTQSTGGLLEGSTYVYVGGNTTVKSDTDYPNQVMNRAVGGNVFGAGCGYSTTSTSGKVTLGTNVVVSDDAYIERGVYGGGSYGFCADDKTSSLFILGGTVAGKSGGVNGTSYDNSIQGGVYGGACQNIGGSANIYMDGGIVSTGIYGGSNKTGTLSGSVTMQINGGQVGTSTTPANIHGGGYGQNTDVDGDVDVTIGTRNTSTGATAGTAIIYGDVYGGSALGLVNTNSSNHTNVTLNAGTINGSLYGGALGSNAVTANVNGMVAVKVYGGSVKKTPVDGSGCVYGANNINGAPQNSVTVDIYGTNSAPEEGEYALFSVYGGGNKAGYTYGNGYPKVTVHNCDNSIEYVYGGGNAAAVAATDVTIYGGNKIGNVFGGGNGQVTAANVTPGGTNVKIYGGTIGDVYGGSNTNGTIEGTISVNVNAQTEEGHDACAVNIDNVYGGGNKAASNVGNITIGCAEHIGAVYGGANQADVTGPINLTINAGKIDNVFGGNNNSGAISGNITVTINQTNMDCWQIGNVFGGGNKADFANNTTVNIKNGSVTNVYGGGNEASIGSTSTVAMTGGAITGGLYGGCNTSGTVSGDVTVTVTDGNIGTSSSPANIHGGGYGESTNVSGNVDVTIGEDDAERDADGPVIYGDVYGGSALGNVNGTEVDPNKETNVTLNAGTINGSLYGGGLGQKSGVNGATSDIAANVYGNVQVTVNGGSVKKTDVDGSGGVYGCNNINGAPQRFVTVEINGTNSAPSDDEYALYAVYGGGNQADYTYEDEDGQNPEVDVHNCDNSIEYVYGGGNAAAVPNTYVSIDGGKIGNVFGGGNGESGTAADVTGEVGTYVMIFGGTIGNVYGGSNKTGTISGPIKVQVNALEDGCPIAIENVYGGGNQAASNAGEVTIGCTGTYVPASEGASESGYIRNVYGGANKANITGDIALNIKAGHIDNVFGGNNNSGAISGTITVNVEEDRSEYLCGMEVGNVYGGGNKAPYSPTIPGAYPEVNIKNGTVSQNVYGGGLGSSATVTSNPVVTLMGGSVTGNIFGGGDAAPVTGNPTVVANYGSTTNIYAGGKGSTAIVTGSPTATINLTSGKTLSVADVFGGGDAAAVQAPASGTSVCTVNMQAGSVSHIYGGGNQAGVSTTDVNVSGGAITGGLYGGCNTSGTVTGDIAVDVTGGTIGTSETAANVHGGGFGANTKTNGDVTVNIGTNNEGTLSGTAVIYGDVYGGSALGEVNNETTDKTNVTLNLGTIHGDLYGGGLGRLADVEHSIEAVAANVAGSTVVTINDGTVNNVFGCNNFNGNPSGASVTVNGGTINNNVYGGGNLAAASVSPEVTINNGTLPGSVFGGGKGDDTDPDHAIAAITGSPRVTIGSNTGTVTIQGNVFGGGDAANVVGAPEVIVNNCNTTIGTKTDDVWNTTGGTVYGGGNAAHVSGTDNGTSVTINGGNIYRVFGGGNGERGESYAANVAGDAAVEVHAGLIHQLFAGSNMHGSIDGEASVTIDHDNNSCNELIDEVYGGGNMAPGNAGEITIECGAEIGDLYGGANQANVTNDIVVNVTGGTINRVFGGNNTSGNVTGSITVNINKGSSCDLDLNYVYGAGNQAAYAPTTPGAYPAVNILNGTVKHDVFGGGLGASATVTSNPVVDINGGDVTGDVYGGGSLASVTGNTTVNLKNANSAVTGNIYGGGLGRLADAEHSIAAVAANVSGTTSVTISDGVVSNVFGCNNINGAPTTGASVTVNGGTINSNVYGGGNLAAASVSPEVTINNGTLPGSVFGGGYGASAIITGNPSVVIGNDTEGQQVTISGNVFGGGDAANVAGKPKVVINDCNTVIGTYTEEDGTIVWDATDGTVYGGGNAADITGSGNGTDVTINGGKIHRAFGGGNGAGEGNPGANVAGNTLLTIKGGTVGEAFGGSNARGTIGGKPNVVIDNANGDCELNILDIYGGGNETPSAGGHLIVEGCKHIRNVYGGANNADITSDIEVTIRSGYIQNVFGGNNNGGNIAGSIIVNIDWDGSDCWNVDNVYGAGNLATYTAPTASSYGDKAGKFPEVNIKNGKVNYNVFGGGLGATAVVTGNPQVNLTGGSCQNVYGGGNAAPVTGSTNVTINATSRPAEGEYHVEKCVYGGGLGATAVISNDTHVTITGNSAIHGNVYGGGNAGKVQGSTHIDIK